LHGRQRLECRNLHEGKYRQSGTHEMSPQLRLALFIPRLSNGVYADA
jgi:hypothetical protein